MDLPFVRIAITVQKRLILYSQKPFLIKGSANFISTMQKKNNLNYFQVKIKQQRGPGKHLGFDDFLRPSNWWLLSPLPYKYFDFNDYILRLSFAITFGISSNVQTFYIKKWLEKYPISYHFQKLFSTLSNI